MLDQSLQDIRSLVKVEVSNDQMQAFLLVQKPDGESRPFLTTESLVNILNQDGISVGINREVLDEVIQQQQWGERVVAAEGIPPIPGHETQLEFSFPTEQSLRPKCLEDGQLDYKDVNVVHSVQQDDLLVTSFPPTEGTPGMDVLGNEVPASAGREIVLVPGTGTYRDPLDHSRIRAATDGVVCYKAHTGVISVQEMFLVKGSVDYSIGNLHVASSVKVLGDVTPGLTIATPYDVDIRGVVEHATISCEGNLKVGAGITGDEHAVVQVGGDVHARYIYNQALQCGGGVYVTTEIRNANIESQDEVVVTSPQGVIVGGHITATRTVSVATIGNVSYTSTTIEVGVNSRFVEEIIQKEEEKRGVEQQVQEMRQKVTAIMQESTKEKNDSRLRALKEEWETLSRKIITLEQDIQEMQVAYIPAGNPIIRVRKQVFPNTLIKIQHAVYHVTTELPGGIFRLQNEKIVFCRAKGK